MYITQREEEIFQNIEKIQFFKIHKYSRSKLSSMALTFEMSKLTHTEIQTNNYSQVIRNPISNRRTERVVHGMYQ